MTGVSLRILQNPPEHHFYKKSLTLFQINFLIDVRLIGAVLTESVQSMSLLQKFIFIKKNS